jgi:hypothetical protein
MNSYIASNLIDRSHPGSESSGMDVDEIYAAHSPLRLKRTMTKIIAFSLSAMTIVIRNSSSSQYLLV